MINIRLEKEIDKISKKYDLSIGYVYGSQKEDTFKGSFGLTVRDLPALGQLALYQGFGVLRKKIPMPWYKKIYYSLIFPNRYY